jgi:hypothetical protein
MTRVSTLGKGIYRIKQGNLYGIEVNGELKIPPDYNILQLEYADYMEATKEYDSSKAAKMGFKGIINSNNDIIIPFRYSVAKINKRYKTVSVCTPKEDKRCGICDFKNNFIIPLKYKIPCQSNTTNFTKHPSVAYICFDNNHSFLYDSLGVMLLDLPFVSIFEADPKHYIVYTSLEGMIGITDSNFNIIIEPIYKSYYWVHKNYMCLGYNKDGKNHSVILDLNDKSIKLDLEGRFDIWDNGKLYHNNSQVYDLNTFQILNKY